MAEGQEEEEEKIVVVGAGGDDEKIIVGPGGDEEKKIVGAGDDDAKKIVLVGPGGDNKQETRNDGRIFPPPGFRFKPKHNELVMYYLLPMLQGREHVPNDNIIVDNVYKCHPEKLVDKYRNRGEDSWYFLSPRARKYLNGNRPSRSTEDKSGRWKASTGKKKVVSDDGGKTITKSSPSTVLKVTGDGKTEYLRSTLTFHEGPIKGEKKSKWLMKEFTIPAYEMKRNKNGGDSNADMLDRYVMCRIYETKRQKDDDEAGPSGMESEPAVSGQATATAGPSKLSEKQAGKRPAQEQRASSKRARRPAPDRLNLGPPAPPLHGNGLQAPFRAPGYYGGGPGRPMGYLARAPMPRPPLVYNNGQPAFSGQGQVPRQPMANNGQVLMPPRQQLANNGQVLMPPRQQVANNGQVLMTPRQQVAHNGQVLMPPRQQQVAYNGQVLMPPRQQQVANNGQVLMPSRQQQVAYNSQLMTRAPVLKPSPPFGSAGTPSSDAQNQQQTMMSRPPYPAGQAVNSPSSVVPRPAQTQKQPETDEMRMERVLRQNVEEFYRMRQSSTRQQPESAAHAAQQQGPTAFTHQQQRQTMPFTQHQQRPTAFTHQQQRPTAFTHQQQMQMMASTQQQQQRRMMAPTQQQQQPRPMTASTQQQQQRRMMAPTQPQQRPPMMAFTQHQQRQQPNLGANTYHHHHAGAMAHQLSLENLNASEAAQGYQHGGMFLPATSGSDRASSAGSLVSSVVSGAGAEGAASGASRDCSNGDNMELVESATDGGNASSADGDGPKYDSTQ